VFNDAEAIEQLITSLNARGHRESKLREKLTTQKNLILENLSSNSAKLVDLAEVRRFRELALYMEMVNLCLRLNKH